MTEARLVAPDGGFRLSLPAELLEAIAERAADMVLERLESTRPAAGTYLTVPEAAELLRCRRQRIDDLLSAGKLRRVKEGRRTLVELAEINDYLAGKPTGRAAPTRPRESRSGSRTAIPAGVLSQRPRAASLGGIVRASN